MNKSKLRLYIVVVALFAALTVIAFAIPFKHNAVFWLAYAFAVLALVAQIYVYPKAFAGESARSKFYGFPIARISTIYLAVQLALSIIAMIAAPVIPVWAVILVFILALCAAVIGFVSADEMREEIGRQDVKLKKNVNVMRGLQSKASVLVGQGSAATAPALKKLAEQFQFSDPVSVEALEDAENELSALLDELQKAVADGDDAAVESLCRKTSAALTERNRLCKLNK